jgi:hypothetical protein
VKLFAGVCWILEGRCRLFVDWIFSLERKKLIKISKVGKARFVAISLGCQIWPLLGTLQRIFVFDIFFERYLRVNKH